MIPLNIKSKQEWRSWLRSRFPGEEKRNQESAEICRHLLSWEGMRAYDGFGAFMPMDHEAQIFPVIQMAWINGITVCLPRVNDDQTMDFCIVKGWDDLSRRQVTRTISLWQPAPELEAVLPERMGFMLIPLEGVDLVGTRLGKGAGYYDRFLQEYEGITIGVALSNQIVSGLLPKAAWDVPLDAVVAASGFSWFSKGNVQK